MDSFFFFLSQLRAAASPMNQQRSPLQLGVCWNAQVVDKEGINANGLREGVFRNSGGSKTVFPKPVLTYHQRVPFTLNLLIVIWFNWVPAAEL